MMWCRAPGDRVWVPGLPAWPLSAQAATSSPKAGQLSPVVVSVSLKLPLHPREGKTVTLI